MAITGNLDVPGGNLLEPFDLSPPPKSSETSMKPLGTDLFPLTSRAHLPTVWKTIVSGEPYKVAGMLIFGGNPADTDVNSKFVREALSKLEFLVVVDFFMTATATFADVVLPAANFLESESYTQGNRVVEPPGQAWSDHRILLELGRKMGYGEALEVVQRRFDAERKTASSERTPRAYRKYVHTGFHTPSGKVELYSERLQAQGFNPLPDYVEPHYSPLNSTISDKYPLVLTVGAKLPMYTHSQFRNIPRLRQLMPHNMFLVNEKTADKYNLKNGERVIVETESGRLEGPLEVASDLLDDVVQTFHGFDEMNANILTSNKSFDYATGSPGSKSMMCRIMKANSLL
jgi:anaerobic selenocysteine-containing dehydrogenase